MLMKKRLRLLLLIPVALLLASWGSTAHRIVNERAVESFPPSMQFMTFWSDLLTEHAMDADYRKDEDPSEAPRHYINLDDYPGFLSTGTIPHGWNDVVAAFGLSFVLDKGIVPWATGSAYDTLVACFKRHDFSKAMLTAADLGHYIADAHNPMHLTRNYDGQYTGQEGLHYRYETGMINRYDDQIAFEAGQVELVTDLNEYIFGYVDTNYLYLDSILLADQEATQLAGSTSGSLYYQYLWERTGGFTTQLLKNASNILATLIYNAWLEAGSPVFWPDGIGEEAVTGLTVYPVPAAGELHASFRLPRAGTLTAEVLNMAGATVYSETEYYTTVGSYSRTLQLPALAPGVYMLTMELDGRRSVVRFLVSGGF